MAATLLQFITDNVLLILMALTSGFFLLWPTLKQRGGGAGSVSTAEAVRLINREKGVLIDVGEPAEFAASHAGGARNVPFGQLEAAAGAKGNGLPTNKTLPLLLLCPTGARAGRAAALLRKQGYDKAVAVAGGTNAWRDAGLPVEKSAAVEKAA